MDENRLLHGLRQNSDFEDSIKAIVKATLSIWEKPQHRYYTGHNTRHADAVIRKLDLLSRRCDPPLNAAEAYVLVAAAHLHDIGMQKEVPGKDLEQIRDEHAELGAQWVIDSCRPGSTVRSLGVECRYADAIAQVMRGHRGKDLASPAYDDTSIGGAKIRKRLLAALLQLADELELEYTRVDLRQAEYSNVPTESLAHWFRHEYIDDVEVVNEDGFIRVRFRFPADDRTDYAALIADGLHSVLAAKIDYLGPILRASGVSFYLHDPHLETSPTMAALPDEVRVRLTELAAGAAQLRKQELLAQAAQHGSAFLTHQAEQIEHAQALLNTNDVRGAAHLYEQIAQAFDGADNAVAASTYHETAAQLYERSGQPARAILAYVASARTLLASGPPIQQAEAWSMRAVALVEETAAADLTQTPEAAAEAYVVHAQVACMHYGAEMPRPLLDQAIAQEATFSQTAKPEQEHVVARMVETLAQCLTDLDRWDEAEQLLENRSAQLTDLEMRATLLTALTELRTQRGQLDDAAVSGRELEALSERLREPTQRVRAALCLAELAQAQGDHPGVMKQYDRAFALLAGGRHEPLFAEVRVQRDLYVMTNDIAADSPPLGSEDALRSDAAYDALHPLTRAALLEESGLALAANELLGLGLATLRQAESLYRRYGAARGQRHAQLHIARALAQAGRRIDALVIYARLGDREHTRELCGPLVDDVHVATHLPALISRVQQVQTARACVGRATVYTELADVLPAAHVATIVEELVRLLDGPDGMDGATAVRPAAARALAALAPRVQESQLHLVVDRLADCATRRSGYMTMEAVIDGLVSLVRWHRTTLPAPTRKHVVGALLDIARVYPAPLADTALMKALAVAHVGDDRSTVTNYIAETGATPERVSWMAAVGMNVPADQIERAV
jgi:hypothetical protein